MKQRQWLRPVRKRDGHPLKTYTFKFPKAFGDSLKLYASEEGVSQSRILLTLALEAIRLRHIYQTQASSSTGRPKQKTLPGLE